LRSLRVTYFAQLGLLEKLKDPKNQLENPYKFAEKDTLKITTKEIFI
jgi:hypothetical protein